MCVDTRGYMYVSGMCVLAFASLRIWSEGHSIGSGADVMFA